MDEAWERGALRDIACGAGKIPRAVRRATPDNSGWPWQYHTDIVHAVEVIVSTLYPVFVIVHSRRQPFKFVVICSILWLFGPQTSNFISGADQI